jgi:hypothetical protein
MLDRGHSQLSSHHPRKVKSKSRALDSLLAYWWCIRRFHPFHMQKGLDQECSKTDYGSEHISWA